MACRECCLAEADMTPQIGIGELLGIRDDYENQQQSWRIMEQTDPARYRRRAANSIGLGGSRCGFYAGPLIWGLVCGVQAWRQCFFTAPLVETIAAEPV